MIQSNLIFTQDYLYDFHKLSLSFVEVKALNIAKQFARKPSKRSQNCHHASIFHVETFLEEFKSRSEQTKTQIEGMEASALQALLVTF